MADKEPLASSRRAGVVFAFKRSYCRAGQWRRAPLPRRLTPAGHELHDRAYHRPASLAPRPAAAWRRFPAQAVMGFINWKRGRERLNDMAMLDRLVADLRAQRPDHVAVTGDLVNIGMPAEFRRAARMDGDPRRSGGRQLRARQPRRLCARGHAAARGDVCALDDGRRAGAATYPYLRVRGEIAIIGLTSAVPTGPLMASGRLGERAARGLRRTARRDGRQGPGAGRAHPSPAARRGRAAACAASRTPRPSSG